LLAAPLLATACAQLGFTDGGSPAGPPAPIGGVQAGNGAAPSSTKIGILLPLSGRNGGLGAGMLHGAQLALAGPGSPVLDTHDTAGPGGAAAAAQAAVQNGDGIILGPLTTTETAAAAPIASSANIPVLAFTSDLAQARPGVWVMGLTPEQQVRRLVFAAKAEGRSRMAALLPSNALGDALASGLRTACADAGLPPPTIVTHGESMDSINDSMRQLSDYGTRHGGIEQQVKDAKASTDPAEQAKANQLAAQPLPPPPFDALLLGDTGLQLQEVISTLGFYGVDPAHVRIMGPTLWGAFASKLKALSGAWYAGPDPSAQAGFAAQYQAKYGRAPALVAGYPYDAAALARNLAPTGYSADQLTRSSGFAGVDGVFALLPDGHVRRGLAIFQIQPGGGATVVQPAPRSLSPTGS